MQYSSAGSNVDSQSVAIPLDSISYDWAQCDGDEIVFKRASVDDPPDNVGVSQELLSSFTQSNTSVTWVSQISYTCGCWLLPDPTVVFVVRDTVQELLGPYRVPIQPGFVYIIFTNADFTCVYRNIPPPLPSSGAPPACSPTPSPVSPTPSITPSPSIIPSSNQSEASDESGLYACFGADATVRLDDGSMKRMSELKIGDHVLVAPGTFSRIFMFTHKLPHVQSRFVQICADHACIQISSTHYIYVDGDQLIPASQVRPGYKIGLLNYRWLGIRYSVVRSVSIVTAVGLYNPHTLHGDVVVDNVRVSTYTKAVPGPLAHSLLTPIRLAYRIFFLSVSQ